MILIALSYNNQIQRIEYISDCYFIGLKLQ